jgi:hypothetical protein
VIDPLAKCRKWRAKGHLVTNLRKTRMIHGINCGGRNAFLVGGLCASAVAGREALSPLSWALYGLGFVVTLLFVAYIAQTARKALMEL